MDYNTGNVKVAEIVCGKPEVPAHGYIQHSTDFTYPNTVEFACADGYRMKGQRLMRCEISAEWSGTPPQCALADVSFPWWALVVSVVIILPVSIYIMLKCYMKRRREHQDQEECPPLKTQGSGSGSYTQEPTTTVHQEQQLLMEDAQGHSSCVIADAIQQSDARATHQASSTGAGCANQVEGIAGLGVGVAGLGLGMSMGARGLTKCSARRQSIRDEEDYDECT